MSEFIRTIKKRRHGWTTIGWNIHFICSKKIAKIQQIISINRNFDYVGNNDQIWNLFVFILKKKSKFFWLSFIFSSIVQITIFCWAKSVFIFNHPFAYFDKNKDIYLKFIICSNKVQMNQVESLTRQNQ